jgi:peptide/nickel transport system ATP-binding protein
MNARVEIRDLTVSYASRDGAICALDGVSLAIAADETIGIVGESGSGKSTLGMAIGRLLAPNASFDGGDVLVEGRSMLRCTNTELRAVRRDRLGFVFQNPMSALDPTMRVGRQIAYALDLAPRSPRIDELLLKARLDDPRSVAASFPHELSGGMAQRVVIALAIARNPAVVIADEPTASLDASIKGAILELLMTLGRDTGASLVIMSHDLRMVARRCGRIFVMYGGRVVESGDSREVFAAPRHPYTQALVRAAAGNEGPGGQLEPIAGVPPVLHHRSADCAFATRCRHAQPICRSQRPPEIDLGSRVVTCHFAAAGLPVAAEALQVT